MPIVERNESPRLGQLFPRTLDEEVAAHQTRNLPERSVSFNRDVHVKRIGRGSPYVTTALVGDGEGRLITTPVRKESIKARSKEDLAQEAARVLQQVDSVACVAVEPLGESVRRYSSLPNRGRRAKQLQHQHQQEAAGPQPRRRRSEDIGVTSGSIELPKPKKKALERSHSDAGSSRKIKQTISKLLSPKLERGQGPPVPAKPAPPSVSVKRSHSDTSSRWQRKRSGSDNETNGRPSRAAAPLSPIIEASPRVVADDQQPFQFGASSNPIPREAKKPKQDDEPQSAEILSTQLELDEVDHVADKRMLHGSRYEQPRAEESAIHKMIHRLSADRSPPPQLTRTMVSPGPGFGHNNNRPFSYTRPNESSPLPGPTDVIYAQVQLDKKKAAAAAAAQRSHSDSDEGLGLERKDSSRENSPAEKDYRGLGYYALDLQQRNNAINSYKSRYDDALGPTNAKSSTHFGDFEPPKDHKYTSTIFVDGSSRGRADGMDSKRRDSGSSEFGARVVAQPTSPSTAPGLNKSSDLSARRDLLESRIKSRLLADEMFAAKNVNLPPKKSEHEIIDKPIVPSPVVPCSRRTTSPKRYMDTYISETRTNSNGEKYIFEKEVHDENGKVYGYEKKINKLPADATYVSPEVSLGSKSRQPKPGYTLETRTDKYGDRYIIETRTHGDYVDDFKPLQSLSGDRSMDRISPVDPLLRSSPLLQEARIPSPTLLLAGRKFDKDDLHEGYRPKIARDVYQPKASKKSFEALRGKSKSTQRLDQLGDSRFEKNSRREYMTRSHENLSSVDYVNAREVRNSCLYKDTAGPRGAFTKRSHLDELRETPNDDYDTDISQATNSQLESSSKYHYKETQRTTQRYLKSKHGLHDDYDSSPPRIRVLGERSGYSSSRYDSDTTARDSLHCESSCYVNERHQHHHHHQQQQQQQQQQQHQQQQRILEEDPKKPIRRSRNRLDYLDDSDASRSRSGKGRLEGFDEPPQRPPRAHHESKLRQSRAYGERRQQQQQQQQHQHQRETRLSDTERKDRLADSGIENDYRREPHEMDSAGPSGRPRRRGDALESEDEGIATMHFIKQERRHTDRSMSGSDRQLQHQHQQQQRRYEKYVVYYDSKGSIVQPVLTSKPPSGADNKKYEKKAAKKSGTMSKVKELFRKKEKKAKEEKSKRNMRASSTGALTDDEVSMRYREYRGEQLRSARSARDLGSEINEDEYRQRRRLSTPSGSPSPPRPSRLSRSTGTLTRPEQQFREVKSSRETQPQEAERKGWFKSLSRKNKSNAKSVDKKPRIPESEILTTGTEDEEASSVPERASVQKSLRFFGDTDQESLSSSRERRNKRGGGEDVHGKARREIASPSRHPMGMAVLPGRKSSRLAESALSSGESTTGDSSQQSQNSQRSQRSVVYLHAATVGEIPGPNERRRAASREELNRPLAAHTRTVSRSVSVLAPWRPRHYREPYEINYDQEQHHAKPLATMRRRQRSRETLSRRAKEPRRIKDFNSKSSTINRSTLKPKDSKKVTDRTVSTESLASKSRSVSSRPELSRSTSVPRDPNKSAGWFKLKGKKFRA